MCCVRRYMWEKFGHGWSCMLPLMLPLMLPFMKQLMSNSHRLTCHLLYDHPDTSWPPPCHRPIYIYITALHAIALSCTALPLPCHSPITSLPPPCHSHNTSLPKPWHNHTTALPSPCYRPSTALPYPTVPQVGRCQYNFYNFLFIFIDL